MPTTRRRFLQTSGSALVGASAMMSPEHSLGAGDANKDGPNKPTLVVIYLRGGADPLHAIVPYGDPRYYRDRPTIALPLESKGDQKGLIRIDDTFGFNPVLEPIAKLFQQKQAAAIINVGSTHPTRSHFDAQDFMERAAPGIKTISEGWLNRYLYATRTGSDSYLRGVALQSLLPKSLRGQYPVLAVPEAGSDKAMDTFESLYGGDPRFNAPGRKELVEQGLARDPLPMREMKENDKGATADDRRKEIESTGVATIRQLRELRTIIDNPAGQGYARGPVHRQLRDIAKVIKANAGLEVAAVDFNGWDHHSYQGGPDGQMSNMLGEVATAIGAFVEDLGPQLMQRVCVLTMTEFGRNVKENGNNGTDHGHGGFMLAVGGPVRGGQIYGQWTGLEPRTLDRGRDLPVHTDFRLVFAEVLQSLFAFDVNKAGLFPEYSPTQKALGFMNKLM